MRLKALDHVALRVADLDRSLRFYQALGLKVLRTRGPNADGARFAVIQVGSQELNLSCHPGDVPPGDDRAVGIDHFCFEVDAASIEEVIADLRSAGIAVVEGPLERRDSTAFLLRDPDGIHVELQLRRSEEHAIGIHRT